MPQACPICVGQIETPLRRRRHRCADFVADVVLPRAGYGTVECDPSSECLQPLRRCNPVPLRNCTRVRVANGPWPNGKQMTSVQRAAAGAAIHRPSGAIWACAARAAIEAEAGDASDVGARAGARAAYLNTAARWDGHRNGREGTGLLCRACDRAHIAGCCRVAQVGAILRRCQCSR